MKTLLTTFVFALFYTVATAQCNTFFPLKENVKYQYDHYDKKDKLSMRTVQWLKNISGAGNSMKATLVQEMIDVKKNSTITSTEADWSCENGTLHFAINNVAFENVNANSAMSVDISGDKMDIPSAFEVGQQLRDLTYHIKMGMSGMTVMNRSYNVKDRKVEAEEKITTPAGTFDAFRVSFTTTSEGGIGSGTIKTLIWYSKDVGMVKTENYSEKGNLLSRQILSKIEK
jgi:hypothetical protein